MGTTLCKYKDVLGAPDSGAHSWRIGGIAGVDFFLTLMAALVTTWATDVPWPITTIMWIMLGTFFHYIFCVDTPVIRYLSGNN
jgi:hypothetical protein